MGDLISVIIPVYNVEKYISNCVSSVVAQTYKNLDIILVDDGSTDSSGKMCDDLKKVDNRIRVVHRENGGLSAARNTGIEMARGDFITFLDSDDFLLPNMINDLYYLSREYAADFVVGSYIRCEENEFLKDIDLNDVEQYFVNEYSRKEKMKVYLSGNEITTVAWGKLFNKHLFDEIRFPVGKYFEDVFTTYQLVHLANKVVVSSSKGYVYRKNESSISRESFSLKTLDTVDGRLQQADFIEKEYPELSGLAYSSIIYGCNHCLLSMLYSNSFYEEVAVRLQDLYKKYGRYYIRITKQISKKLFVFLAIIDVKIIKKLMFILRWTL